MKKHHFVARERATVAVAALMAATILTGCSEDKIATCDEFAQMASDTGVFVELNSAQTNALKASLRSEGWDDSAYNITIGKTEVIAYCNIYEGRAGQNNSQPISNAH